MQYWHNLITEKSFQVLKELNKKYQFILIGGWAVFLYTDALKSRDIDIVLDYEELSKLKEGLEVYKNSHLKKYEAKQRGIALDIYLPYFSNPGLPAEDLEKFSASKQGFKTLLPEALLVLKQTVFEQRKNTPKGNKDKIDIMAILMLPGFDWKKYRTILRQYHLLKLKKKLKVLLKETSKVKELDLSQHKMAKLKNKVLPKIQ